MATPKKMLPAIEVRMSDIAKSSKIFVVDDDEAVRDAIKGLLVMHGLDVQDFGSTAELVRGYAKPAHGCLILDQHLPQCSGLDFLASVEGRELGIPVILITGQGDENIKRRAAQAGAAYLEKPLRRKNLIDMLERVMGRC